MGKSHQTKESGIGGSLKNSLSKFTERVTLKAPPAEELEKTTTNKPKAPSPLTSQPKPMRAPGDRNAAPITKPSSGPAPKPQQAHTPAATQAPAVSASPNHSPSTPSSVNKLANDVSIVGSLRFSDRLVFDGRIKGEIKSDGALAVQRQAVVEATVSVKTLLVEGKIIGNIFATESVHLAATAVVVGDITTRSLSVEPKASFNGQAKIGNLTGTPKQPVAKTSPRPAAKPATQRGNQGGKATNGQIASKTSAPSVNTPKSEGS